MANARSDDSVLVVDDEDLLRWALVTQLTRSGFECRGCEDAEEALRLLEEKPARLVMLDIRLPGMDGMECLRILRERYPETTVIMMTGHGAIDSAVEAMRAGAYNYLTKPFDYRSVLSMAESILGEPPAAPRKQPRRQRGSGSPPPRPARSAYAPDDLVGGSETMARIRRLVEKVAQSTATTVLVTGQSGTGKDLVAQILHYSSARAAKPFVHVNVASVPSALFESELFGHERGSFTDAHVQKPGLLQLADGGTIYLDEVGELGQEVQTKLLHFLEHRSFRRVGGVDSLQVDVRVVAATNVDLKAKIAAGGFREDLYHRLRVIPIHLPRLTRRENDVFELAEHFLGQFNRSHGKSFRGFDPSAREMLASHPWTGNVRELRNMVERALTLEEGEWINA
ncbi:MAG TPA: sigma-54 dependent transcriptional regulator, partial [bacterium]|nr:sigma-54 dependent transcriptional regulator [bacterium]